MKKLNLKLTLILVSLFISLILLILGGSLKNNFCLCFGMIFLSLALVVFLVGEMQKLSDMQRQMQLEAESVETEEEYLQLKLAQKEMKKQKKMLIFGGFAFAIILFVLGIACVV